MNVVVKDPIAIVAIYLWIGFVTAISFIEAWLKFKAPGVTLQIGLGIGRLVFNALNKSEWIFATAICIGILISKQSFLKPTNLLFYIPLVLLIIQTVWLLPALNNRIEMRLNGIEPTYSPMHIYYVVMEFIKVVSLFIFGLTQFK